AVCEDAAIELTATGGQTYVWQPAEAIINSHKNTATVRVNITHHSFTVTGTDHYGCGVSPRIVTFSVYPNVKGSFNHPLICAGDCAALTFVPSGAGTDQVNATWTVAGQRFLNSLSPQPCFRSPGIYTITGTVTESVH